MSVRNLLVHRPMRITAEEWQHVSSLFLDDPDLDLLIGPEWAGRDVDLQWIRVRSPGEDPGRRRRVTITLGTLWDSDFYHGLGAWEPDAPAPRITIGSGDLPLAYRSRLGSRSPVPGLQLEGGTSIPWTPEGMHRLQQVLRAAGDEMLTENRVKGGLFHHGLRDREDRSDLVRLATTLGPALSDRFRYRDAGAWLLDRMMTAGSAPHRTVAGALEAVDLWTDQAFADLKGDLLDDFLGLVRQRLEGLPTPETRGVYLVLHAWFAPVRWMCWRRSRITTWDRDLAPYIYDALRWSIGYFQQAGVTDRGCASGARELARLLDEAWLPRLGTPRGTP